MSNKSGIGDNVISLPKGGGAQSGMGEIFSPDLFTGTGNFSVPIAVPAGRNGFQPQLSLGYSTGNGNSPFGMGWGISVPGIMRKTNKGIPVYDDERDTFILSGAEDLVLIEKESEIESGITHHQWKYRPRTEGLFARITHHKYSNGRDYWEVKSKDGLTSFYGDELANDDQFQLSDPKLADNIFAWKLSKTMDPFGNTIVYEYDKINIEDKSHTAVQHYLKRIQYMNYLDVETKYLCSIVFEYEDRIDPFSENRAGFEIRTTLRCTAIETYTHPKDADLPDGYFSNPSGNNILVKKYDLKYQDELEKKPLNGASLLKEVQVSGYDADSDEWETMPPLSFGYSEFTPQSRDFFPLTGKALPTQSLASPVLELADLDGNGLPDFIEMNGQSVRFWKNLGNGNFSMPQSMKNAPAFSLADPEVQLMDADGDGRIDLVVSKAGQNGYFPLNHQGSWDSKGMRRYKTAPSFSFNDPEVKMLDLDGDGVTDILRSGSKFQNFYQRSHANGTLKAEGWSKANVTNRGRLESFPNVSFANPQIKLADMNGDGLQDIVQIENGNVWYWPNLGHGRWGKRRVMGFDSAQPDKGAANTQPARGTAKAFLFPAGWDPQRVILGDIVGDGLADLMYVENGKVNLWINQSGNKWSEKIVIKGTPAVYSGDAIRLVDLLGSGVAGLLYTYDNNQVGLANQQSYFLDFTSGIKPYVMNTMNNNMGAITKVTYESSVQAWIKDNTSTPLSARRKWKTTLPFPVQVVAKTEVIDEISKGKLATQYRYSHGYWDGYEREFRGFGRVEQFDTETFERYNKDAINQHQAVDFIHYSSPIKTINWFHLGGINHPDPSDGKLFFEADFSEEYWNGDQNVLERSTATTDLLKSLTPHDRRDAYRAWRGSKLRTELYAADANGDFTSPLAQKPFTISESSFGIRLEQASGIFVDASTPLSIQNNMATERSRSVFFSFSEASRTTNWERGDEPKTSFSFTADFDAYGQAKQQISIAVPRGKDPLTGNSFTNASKVHSGGYFCTFGESSFIYKDEATTYICDRTSEQKSFEIINDGSSSVFQLRDLILDNLATKNILEHSLIYYDGLAYTGLALGTIGSYGVVSRTESLYSTLTDLDAAYATRPEIFKTSGSPDWSSYPSDYDTEWPNDRAGYEYKTSGSYETGFYKIGERKKYDFQAASGNLGLVIAMKDLFDNEATVEFDSYSFLPKKVTDPIGIETSAAYDYRILQAALVTDANDNQTAFRFSPLGLLKSTAVMGKAGDNEGDTLADPGTVMEYDFNAYYTAKQPIWVKTIRREHHINDGVNNDTITAIEYSDGFGRLLQSRGQAEDVTYLESLPAVQSPTNIDAVGTIKAALAADNVVVNGFKVYNNKGKVVEQYEPYFETGYNYTVPVKQGQKVRLFYDVLDRPTQTLNPDGTAQLSIYGIPTMLDSPTQLANGRFITDYQATPWESYAYDANDLGGDTHPTESSAYSTHWNTPESSEIDALGRTIKTTQRLDSSPANNVEMKYQYDIQGRLTEVTDPEDRVNFEYSYATVAMPKGEEAAPPEAEALKIWHLDSGTKTQIFDGRGQTIERIDEKQNRTIVTSDYQGRPISLYTQEYGAEWRLIHFYAYGDSSKKANNQVGKIFRMLDESGQYRFENYDFKGNLLQKSYQPVKDDLLTGTEKFKINWITVNLPNSGTLDAQIFETNTEYDGLNRIKKLILPEDVDNENKEIVPTYNRSGGLEKVHLDGDEYVKEIAYDAKGQRLLISFGNGVMNRYAYDAQNFRLKRMKSEKYTYSESATERTYTVVSGTARQDIGYEYDLNGNILKKKNRTPDCGISGTALGVDGLDNQYTYDAISRLLSATGRESDANNESHRWADAPAAGSPNASNTQSYNRQYTYDKVGNVITLQQFGVNAFTRTFNYTANTLNNITVSGTPTAFMHDANGNMTQSSSSRYYEWNEHDQLVFFKVQAGEEPSLYAHYLYDSGGNRTKKIVWDQQGNKEVTVFIDGIFEYRLKQEGGTEKEQNIIHVMDDQTRIAQLRVGTVFTDDISEEAHYILDDHLGSSNARLDDTGSIIDRQEYYPFGDTSLRTFSKIRYQYVGKEKDAESGLIYYGARYYAAWTCRFISVDPLASKYQFYSPYIYAGNKPINKVDIDGLQEENARKGEQGGGGSRKGGDNASKDSTNSGGTDQNSVMHGNDKSETINAYSIEHGEIKFDPIIIDDGKTLETNPEESFNTAKSELQKILPKLPSEESTMETIETEDPGMIDYEPQEQTKEEKKSFFNTVYSIASAYVQKTEKLLIKGGKQLARATKFVGNAALGLGFLGVFISIGQSYNDISENGPNRENITKAVIGFGIAVLASIPATAFIGAILAISYSYADDQGYIDLWIKQTYEGFDEIIYKTQKGFYDLEKGLQKGWRL